MATAVVPNLEQPGASATSSRRTWRASSSAYRFAEAAHAGQSRQSGEPYISHPLAVAEILADWQLDAQALIAALLHDVIEDTARHQDRDRRATSASRSPSWSTASPSSTRSSSQTREEAQAESFRKMLLAMARDVRVILIKLADRLHNMRTLDAMPPDEARAHRARDARDLRADRPPARPEQRSTASCRTSRSSTCIRCATACSPRRSRPRAATAARSIEQDAGRDREGARRSRACDARSSRPREDALLDLPEDAREAPDVRAGARHLRLPHHRRRTCRRATSRSACCTRCTSRSRASSRTTSRSRRRTATSRCTRRCSARSARRSRSRSAPRRCTASPRRASPRTGSTRTTDAALDRAAAADPPVAADRCSRSSARSGDSDEFLEHVKVDLFPDEVYVFTPKGKILALPRGATAVDFAYAVHTDVGNRCVAAQDQRRAGAAAHRAAATATASRSSPRATRSPIRRG